jgi:hypothetical protein
MLLLKPTKSQYSIVKQGEKANKVFATHLSNHKNECSSCGFLNEFNPDSFLDTSHLERKNVYQVPDLNNPELVDTWWNE